MASPVFNSTADINSYVQMAINAGEGVVNPAAFYDKQLLDTIRTDADQYVYYRLADSNHLIPDQSDKLTIRRWSPLRAHTQPLVEGIPPESDKGSVEKYELQAAQYGRYMQFTDKVSFKVVDPIIAHYTKEYGLVALETLDMLARETLFSIAQRHFAGGRANYAAMTIADKPSLAELRLIIISMKKQLVKPRSNGFFHVIASADFYLDMFDDPLVQKWMEHNQTTKPFYDAAAAQIPPMFNMEFYETTECPINGFYSTTDGEGVVTDSVLVYLATTVGETTTYTYKTVTITTGGTNSTTVIKRTITSGYENDSRTGDPASYIPNQEVLDWEAWGAVSGNEGYKELKLTHVLIVGKDALARTGMTGQDSAKTYVKPLGSSGVLDPIDQRQSIGFKINSVGFGSTRLEAVADYICVPSNSNIA